MNITLTPEQEKFIQDQLQNGKYITAEQVITKALQLLAEQNEDYQKWEEETRQKVTIGLAQLARGEGIDAKIVINQLKDKVRQIRDS